MARQKAISSTGSTRRSPVSLLEINDWGFSSRLANVRWLIPAFSRASIKSRKNDLYSGECRDVGLGIKITRREGAGAARKG